MNINQKGGMSQSIIIMIILFCCCCCYIYITLTCSSVAYYIYNKPKPKPKPKNTNAPNNTTSSPITTIPPKQTSEPILPTIYKKIKIFLKINGVKYYIYNNTNYTYTNPSTKSGNFNMFGITNKFQSNNIYYNKYLLFCENKDITKIVQFDKLKTNTEYLIIRNTIKNDRYTYLESGGKQIFYFNINKTGNKDTLLSNVCKLYNGSPLSNLSNSMLLKTLYSWGSKFMTKDNKLISPFDSTAIFIIKESGVTNTTPQLLDISKKYIFMNPTYKYNLTWYMFSNTCIMPTNDEPNSIEKNGMLTTMSYDNSLIIKAVQEWQFEIDIN